MTTRLEEKERRRQERIAAMELEQKSVAATSDLCNALLEAEASYDQLKAWNDRLVAAVDEVFYACQETGYPMSAQVVDALQALREVRHNG